MQPPQREDLTGITSSSSDQGPVQDHKNLDCTRISTRSSDKDLCDIMEGGSSQYLLPMASTRPRSGSACLHVLRTSKAAPWTLARSFTKILEIQPKISTAPQRERSDPHKVPRWLREHMSRDPPPANVLATPRKYHACPTDQKCPISCTCHAKLRSRPQNASKAPCLPYEMDIAQKTSTPC